MLAHAIRRTTPVTAKSRLSGVLASSCTLLWPRWPWVKMMGLLRNRSIVASLMPVCSGASTSLMIVR